MDTALDRRLSSIEKKLSLLLGEKKRAAWVKAGAIMQLTGWGREDMRRMRINGIINWKKDEKGFWYDLNSIPERFIKTPSI
jgi:hypothetical protein